MAFGQWNRSGKVSLNDLNHDRSNTSINMDEFGSNGSFWSEEASQHEFSEETNCKSSLFDYSFEGTSGHIELVFCILIRLRESYMARTIRRSLCWPRQRCFLTNFKTVKRRARTLILFTNLDKVKKTTATCTYTSTLYNPITFTRGPTEANYIAFVLSTMQKELLFETSRERLLQPQYSL